ncbi:MAG: hypothetical protein ACQETL_11890 [Bacteroidota bacterium]
MKFTYSLLFALMLTSCSQPASVAEYKAGRQILNVNELTGEGEPMEAVNLKIIKPDSVKIKEEAIFRIVTTDPAFKIVNGIFDCDISNQSLIDTTSFKVDDCIKGFAVKNDTMYIAFKPQKIGTYDFWTEIVGISKGPQGLLRYHTGTFQYTVTE